MDQHWTTTNIPDLAGKVVIVTGANVGVGYEAAKEFARKGAQTILACRNIQKAQAAIEKIRKEIPAAPVEAMLLDLASLASVHKFTDSFKTKYDRLDILVNNAGIMWLPPGKTEDGFERHFGTNHLGHFALTGLLIDLLQKTPGARVVTVSSVGHHSGSMDFEDLMFEKTEVYERQKVYGRSKLANLLFTYELQRRLETSNMDTIAVAAHPGMCKTDLLSKPESPLFFKLVMPLAGLVVQSAAMGALPILRAAVDPEARGGEYYGPDGKNESRGYPVIVQSNEASHNMEDAARLWEVSEKLTGIHYL
jgi:NAD(P)-dependent dehydrogenase (short-subunit alcohol dehydrogenase family)